MENLNSNEDFERRHYTELRRHVLAPAIGTIALKPEMPAGYEKRRYEELVDGIAEAIPGVVRNTREYRCIKGVLVAEDGQAFSELLLSGYRYAEHYASLDSFYADFWTQRASHEIDEAREWQKMADGLTNYNTLITYSPLSEEFLSPLTINKLETAGQDPKRKRAMIRIGHWDGERLHVITRSIDNSSLETLREASFKTNGYEFIAANSTAMLSERQYQNMNIAQAQILADRIVDEADGLISAELGHETKQGCPVYEAKDTQAYVESQTAILNELIKVGKRLALQHSTFESYEKAWHLQIHKYTALIKERISSGNYGEIIDIGQAANVAGALAAARGETFNMCGLIISANSEAQPGQNIEFESIKSLSRKKVQCPGCKEKVTVNIKKLEAGRLCCPECKFEVEVCSGKVLNLPSKKNSTKSGLAKKETDWQRIVREDEEKKLRRRLEQQQAQQLRKVA